MLKKILLIFFTWRISLFVVAFLAIFILPQFGNRFPYADQTLKITGLPNWVWGFGNFDGVHYLRIAQNGYDSDYSQAFFPLYPLLVGFLTNLNIFIHKNPVLDTRIYVDPGYFFTAFALSNIFFLMALIFLYKLFRTDFNQKTSFSSLVLLTFFPTSFYFGSVYTESLFLFLAAASLYFIKKENFLAAGIFSAFASATRVFGLLLIPVILIEIFIKYKKKLLPQSWDVTKAIVGILIAPSGLLLYMLYLRLNFDKPLYFLTSQPLFGAERSSGNLVFLPQVIFRYLKIFVTVPATSQLFLNALLEFGFTVVALVSIVLFIKKMKLSYLVFSLGCLIMPTLTGTFSSMPRYSLMGFLVLPFITQSAGRYYKLLLAVFMLSEIILVSLFVRGYWVA